MLRSLATMLEAGIPIHRALELLARQGDEPSVRSVCAALAAEVARGQRLSRALHNQQVFSPFQIGLVEAGEGSGTLTDILVDLADYEESSHKDGMEVAAALVYPGFVLGLCLILLFVGPTYLLSGQFQLLSSMGVQLPGALQALRKISAVVCSWPFVLVASLAVAGLLHLLRRKTVQTRLYNAVVTLPVLERVFRCLAISRFARAMAVQLRAGVPAAQSLATAARAAGHPRLSADVAVHHLHEGCTLRESLAVLEFFPRTFLEFMTIGERVGGMPKLMTWLGDLYHDEFQGAVRTALNALQPVAMLVTGIVAASVMLATLLPMVRAIQQL